MNDRQRRFVEAYVRLGVASKAAIEAGYSPKSAEVDGPRLLRNAQIREAVDQRQANLANELGYTRQWVLEQLAAVHRAALEDEKPQLAAGNKALELIGKAHGMWVDRQQVETSGMVTYTLDLGGSLGGDDEDVDDGAEQ